MDEREPVLGQLLSLVGALALLAFFAAVVTHQFDPLAFTRGLIDSLGGPKEVVDRLVSFAPFLVGIVVFFLLLQLGHTFLENRWSRPQRSARHQAARDSVRTLSVESEAASNESVDEVPMSQAVRARIASRTNTIVAPQLRTYDPVDYEADLIAAPSTLNEPDNLGLSAPSAPPLMAPTFAPTAPPTATRVFVEAEAEPDEPMPDLFEDSNLGLPETANLGLPETDNLGLPETDEHLSETANLDTLEPEPDLLPPTIMVAPVVAPPVIVPPVAPPVVAPPPVEVLAPPPEIFAPALPPTKAYVETGPVLAPEDETPDFAPTPATKRAPLTLSFTQHEAVREVISRAGGPATREVPRLIAEWCMEQIYEAKLYEVQLRRVEWEEGKLSVYFGPAPWPQAMTNFVRLTTLTPQFNQLGKCTLKFEKGNVACLSYDKIKTAALPIEILNWPFDEKHHVPLLFPIGQVKRRQVWLNLQFYRALLLAGKQRADVVDTLRSLLFSLTVSSHPRFLRIALLDDTVLQDFRALPHTAFKSVAATDLPEAIHRELFDRLRQMQTSPTRVEGVEMFNVNSPLRISPLLLVVSDLKLIDQADFSRIFSNPMALARAGIYVAAAAPSLSRAELTPLSQRFPARVALALDERDDMELSKILVNSKIPLRLRPGEGVFAAPSEGAFADTLALNTLPLAVIDQGLREMIEHEKLSDPYGGSLPVPLSGEEGRTDLVGGSDAVEGAYEGLEGLEDLIGGEVEAPQSRPASPAAPEYQAPAPVTPTPTAPSSTTPSESAVRASLEDLVASAPVEATQVAPVSKVAPIDVDETLSADEIEDRATLAALPPPPPEVEGVDELPEALRACIEYALTHGAATGELIRKEMLRSYPPGDFKRTITPILFHSKILDMDLPPNSPKPRRLVVTDRVQAYQQMLDSYRYFQENPDALKAEVKANWERPKLQDDSLDDEIAPPAPLPIVGITPSPSQVAPQVLAPAVVPTVAAATPPVITSPVSTQPLLKAPPAVSADGLPAELVELLDVILQQGFASALILQREARHIAPERIAKEYFPAFVQSGILSSVTSDGRAITPTNAVLPRELRILDRGEALSALRAIWKVGSMADEVTRG